ncbi:MAG: hypothetical protein ABEJ72_00170 [Candidatus Aenigmatarchaeota archaeon]
MPSSTRVGYVGNLEIHLKKRIEITSEIANSISTLPSQEPWYVVTKNTNTNEWLFENSFDSFESADEKFVTICENEGLSKAKRLHIDGESGTGRVIHE